MQCRKLRAGQRLLSQSIVIAAAAAALPSMFHPADAGAATFTWDNNAGIAPNPQDGVGTWNNALLNFWDGANNFTWNNATNDFAVFGAGGTGGSVTVVGTQAVSGLRFDVGGYILSGGSISVIGQTPVIANASANISAVVTGTGPVDYTVNPTFTLTQGAASTFTGGATLTGGGTLALGTTDKVGNGSITINGAILKVNDGRTISMQMNVAASTTGTFQIAGNGTISSAFAGTGTIVLDGAGTANRTFTINTNNSTFAGTVKALNGGIIRFEGANSGSAAARWEVGTVGNNGTLGIRTGSATVQLGELIGTGTVFGPFGTDSVGTLQIGAMGTAGNTATFNGTLANQSAARVLNIRKVGAGNWALTGTNTYTGSTIIDAGTITVAAGATIATTSSYTLNGGNLDLTAVGGLTLTSKTFSGANGKIYGNLSALAGSVITPGTVGTASTLSFGSDLVVNGADLRVDLGPDFNTIGGGVNDYLNITGGLNLASGTLSVNPLAGGFGLGEYTLGNYNQASFSGSASNIPVLFGQRAQGALSAASGLLKLNITSVGTAGTLNWNSTTSSVWNVSGEQNFFNTSTSAQDGFFQGDAVNFLDGAGLQTTITKAGLIQPLGTFTVNSSTNNYTIGGAGTISGISLLKIGTSTLTLSSANLLNGAAVGGGGVLVLTNNNAISNVSSATLQIGTASVFIGNGISLPNNVTINRENATIGILNGNGTLSGSIRDVDPANTANALAHNMFFAIPSGATIAVSPTAFDNYAGTVNLGTSNGILRFTSTTAVSTQAKFDLGTGSATLLSRNGNANSISLGALSGGPNTRLEGNSSDTAVPTTYNIGTANLSTTFNGRITDGSNTSGTADTTSINKIGSATLTLAGNNTYTGTTSVTSGALVVNGSHTVAGAYSVANIGILGGNGVIDSAVTVNSGTLSPGAAVGTFTVGTLALAGGSKIDIEFDQAGSDKVSIKNSLTATATVNVNPSNAGGMIAGTYPILDYTTGTSPGVAPFALTSTSVGGFTLALNDNPVSGAIELLVTGGSGPVNAQWNVNADGNWGTGVGGNWTPSAPDGVDFIANFGSAINASRVVTLDAAKTVAKLNFDVLATGVSYTLNGANTLTIDSTTGTGTINSQAGSHTLGSLMTVQINDNTNVNVNTGDTLTIASNVQAGAPALSVTKTGAGTLVLSGSNTYSGATNINAGTLAVASANALGHAAGGTNNIVFAGGALRATGAVTSASDRNVTLNAAGTIDTNGNTVAIAGAVSGAFGIVKVGAGTLSFSGNNTYSGTTNVAAGVLAASSSEALGDASSTNTLILAGSTLQATGAITSPGTRNVTITGAAGIDTNGNAVSIAGVISGAGSLTKSGAGVYTPASNTYTGGTSINGGVLSFTALNNLGAAASSVTFNGGTLQYAPATTIDLSSKTVVLAAGGGTIDTNGNNVLFASVIGAAGAGKFTKDGAGVLTFNATNTYTGGTTVNAGGIVARKLSNGTITLGGGSIQLTAKGAPNDITGTTIIPALSITGGNLDLTNNALVLTTANTSSTTLQGYLGAGSLSSSTNTGTLAIGYADNAILNRANFAGASVTTAQTLVGIVIRGDANLDGKVNALDFNALATGFGAGNVWIQGDFNYDGTVNTDDFTALAANFNLTQTGAPASVLGALVPEPATFGLIGLLGLAGRRRRQV